MPQILLHIGMHKTGTTSLQTFLASNRAHLAELGILYPGTVGQHCDLPQSVRALHGQPRKDPACWDEILQEISRSGARLAVISSEDFSLLGPEDVPRVRELLGDEPVDVVVYLRNPFDFIASQYKHRIRHQRYPGTFRELVERESFLCNYLRIVQTWAAVFGRDRVQIRLFDKVKGNPRLYHDFMDLIGLSPECFHGAFPASTNVAPPIETMSRIHALNRLERSRLWRLVPGRYRGRIRQSLTEGASVGLLVADLARSCFGGEGSPGEEDRHWFAGHVSGWNEPLVPDWVGEDDYRSYLAVKPS
ncbi:hypothetical protein [Tautonia sociabilis]|uniref:Sulfotransferase domain-containing protein n=1 Tax=Tautonia sociabilis TaxID=2080755 RepID=A0A432MQ88_9BACT|nr:hypothetical protein [Tautonia sociabilis]RUL89307.1 hypothetical protein TsocGM_02500 [Tautonia sociabilis]